MNLKDVKCEKCGRVIGQRDGGLYYPAGGAKVLFTKTQKIFCPFVGCESAQLFPVNRNAPNNILIEFSSLELKS
jgi:hypothetical protein